MSSINNENLIAVRNSLAHTYRFGGVCSALKFNPSNVSAEESKQISSAIINSLNEHFWNQGIDIISTNYSNNASGFMLLTTTENKDAIKSVLSELNITKSLKNEYIVQASDVLALSGKTMSQESATYIMTIYDSYKINTQNQLSLSLSEEANTSANVEICERNIVQHLRNLGVVDRNTDQGLLELLSESATKFANQTKKYVVPALLVVVLFYALTWVWNQWQESKRANAQLNARSVENTLEDDELVGASPAEPGEPGEPSDFDVQLTSRRSGNNRISSLLRTLEDSEVKQVRSSNIEDKILSLLAETTSSH